MDSIHIGRGTTNLGAFSEGAVREGLRTGQFFLTDVGWREGMEKWTPLSRFPEFAPSSSAQPPPLSPIENEIEEQTVVPERPGLPWDHRESLGLFAGWLETVKIVFSSPGFAFETMKRTGGFAGPLFFALPGLILGACMAFFYQSVFHQLRTTGHLDFGFMVPRFTSAIIGAPIGAVLAVFILSAALHITLWLIGAAKQPFETTFRTVCFAHGSAMLLQIVPGFGPIIALMWDLALLITGLARTHEISTGRALVAVLLPFLLFCALIIAVMILMGAAFLRMFGQ